MSRYLPDFAGVFCLAVFLISLATLSDDLLKDGDTFWHIKAGSVMLDQQNLIDKDIFSHTASGQPWTAHEWLAEIIMASVHQAAGLQGVICLFLFIVASAFWLLYKTTEKQASQAVTIGCICLALAFIPMHLAARPHLFTWFFMVLTLAVLTKGGKCLLWLPLIMVVWANLHGGFILGLVLQAIFILGSGIEKFGAERSFRNTLLEHKTAILVLAASTGAVTLNPFGPELLLFPFQVSQGAFSELINEWRAPDLQSMWYFRAYLVALVVLFSLPRSAATWTERLLVVFFINAALTHIRHISLMLIAMTPFIARMLENHLGVWLQSRRTIEGNAQIRLSNTTGPIAMTVISLSLLITTSIDHRAVSVLNPHQIIKVDRTHLEQLVDFLSEDLPGGRMFNEYSLGGYLLYAMEPAPKVFIDGRADMYGEKILTDYGKIIASGQERDRLLDQYEISWIVFDKDSALVKGLSTSGHWQTVYRNDYYEVLTRNGNTQGS